jgi:cytochrome b subunit of formate dehydrogenase
MIDRPPHPVEILFQAVMLVPLVLMGLLMLRDLRMRLRRRDAADRIAAVGIAAAFVVLVAGMVLAAMERPGAEYAWLVAPALLGAAFIAEGTYGWRAPRHHRTRTKPCNLLTLRVQHDALALAIALLALTGIPRHFAEIAWIRNLLIPVGGFAGAALLHRAAGVLLLAVLAWHLCYLLVRWGRAGWSWRSWTMRPIWQDIPDLAHALGLRREPARCGPRRYREKLSYLAQMSAVVMLCATGLVLWFPDMLGGRLPRWVFEVTRAAHSYEFVLALLAVVVWHLYNVHAMARRVTFARYREKGCATAPDGTGTVRDGTSRADTPSPEGTKDDHGHNA